MSKAYYPTDNAPNWQNYRIGQYVARVGQGGVTSTGNVVPLVGNVQDVNEAVGALATRAQVTNFQRALEDSYITATTGQLNTQIRSQVRFNLIDPPITSVIELPPGGVGNMIDLVRFATGDGFYNHFSINYVATGLKSAGRSVSGGALTGGIIIAPRPQGATAPVPQAIQANVGGLNYLYTWHSNPDATGTVIAPSGTRIVVPNVQKDSIGYNLEISASRDRWSNNLASQTILTRKTSATTYTRIYDADNFGNAKNQTANIPAINILNVPAQTVSLPRTRRIRFFGSQGWCNIILGGTDAAPVANSSMSNVVYTMSSVIDQVMRSLYGQNFSIKITESGGWNDEQYAATSRMVNKTAKIAYGRALANQPAAATGT